MPRHDNESSTPPGPMAGAWRRCAIVALASTALLAAALPLQAQARCKITGMVELPVTMAGTRAIATVEINGAKVPLMVDSGAFYSMLTDAAAAQLKLPVEATPHGLYVIGITGAAVTHMTTVDKLHLLGGDIPNAEFLVAGNEPGSGALGIMGRNLLAFTDTEYDLAHGVIRFVFPNNECTETNMAYWAGSTPVSQLDLVRAHNDKVPSIRARILLNDKPVLAMFDTGAQTLVHLRAARRAGVAAEAMAQAPDVHGIGRGSAKAWTAPFDKIDLGDEAILHNRLMVADVERQIDDVEMLVGIDFFLSHRIYVSKKQAKLYFTYNGGPVFALNKGEPAGAIAFDAPPAASAANGAASGSATDTASADQLARRGVASMARHDYPDALADLDRACELDPASAAYRTQRGLVQELLKNKDKALQDFDKALALDPAQAEARFHRAWWRAADHDRDGALQDLAALDKTLAPQAAMRLAMAQLYARLDEQALAVPQLDAWIEAHPNDRALGAAYNSRCWARMVMNRELDRAYKDCDEAVDGDSKNAAFLDSRGWVYVRQGKFRKAIDDFDRSLALRPAAAGTLYGRGLARLRMGQKELGQADIDVAVKAQPGIEESMKHIGLALATAP